MALRRCPALPLSFAATGLLVGAVAVLLAQEPSPEPSAPIASLPPARHPVEIKLPDPNPTVETDLLTVTGKPIGVSCGTCHALREEETMAKFAEDLDVFHEGLTMTHGDLRCASCHDLNDRQDLRLADGTEIGFDQSIELCAQCHGPQHRDYQNGTHGGMMGHWDLVEGPRLRNHCINCHDPHSPTFARSSSDSGPGYRQMMPVFRPRDRFLSSPDLAGDGHE